MKSSKRHVISLSLIFLLKCLFKKVFFAYFRLINYIDKRKLLVINEYGFRKNHSTSLALLYLYDKIAAAVDERKYTAGFFLDLSKVFDTVNHSSLLGKLEHYWIRGLRLNGSRAIFAIGYSMLNSVLFHPLTRKCCVVYLRGQSLVPYFFLIYINDICHLSNLYYLALFDDDKNLFL